MKKKLIFLMAICVVLALSITGCGGSSDGSASDNSAAVSEEDAAASTGDDSAAATGEDAAAGTGDESAAESEQPDAAAPTPEYTNFSYVKEISSETGFDMDVNAVLLTPEGTAVMRTEGALGEAVGWEVALADDVSDIYVEPFGNGGYYAILMIKTDGSVSEVNASALINDKTVEVIDGLGGYKDVSSIESVKDPDAFLINAVMKDGEKYLLDPYLK